MARRRTYAREFKVEAVRQVLGEKRSLSEVAAGLDIHPTLLRKWVNDHKGQGDQAFPGRGHPSPLEEELRRLRLDNKRLLAECEILKKATAFFARELL